jgi:hypothetical protein
MKKYISATPRTGNNLIAKDSTMSTGATVSISIDQFVELADFALDTFIGCPHVTIVERCGVGSGWRENGKIEDVMLFGCHDGDVDKSGN